MLGSTADFKTELEQSIAEDCENSLVVFTREAFKYIDPVKYIHGRHIDMMAEYAEAFIAGEIPRLLINIPPGHMKSIECSVMLNAWAWCKKERAGTRFMGLAYREPLALRDAMKTRNLIRTPWYQDRWGGHVGGLREKAFTINKGQDKITRFENSEGGYRVSGSLNAAMGEGGDFLIYDDPHNVMQAESDEVLEKQIEQINLAATTRVRSKKGGILVIMQRLRERDMSGDMIARGGELVHCCLPARFEYDHPHVTVPKTLKSGRKLSGDWRCDPEILKEYRRLADSEDEAEQQEAAILASDHNGELLFPDLFSEERLDDMLIYLGAYGEAGQFQQRPSPREGGMFQKGDFQIIDRLPEGPCVTARGWDLAASKTKGAAYTAGVLCSYYWRTKQIVIRHVTRGQWSSLEVDNNMRQQAKIDGKAIIQDVPQDPGQAGKAQKRHIADNMKGYRVLFSPETGSKETRAEGLSSQAEAGNVYMLRGDWNQAFIDEADLFPAGTYKDQIDGWSRAYARLLLLMKKRRGKPAAPELVEG